MNDLKFALRQLLKNPGFTTVAVLTLALGIGACTAMFSVVRAVLLRPLPFAHSDRLVWIENTFPGGVSSHTSTVNTFLEWRAQNQSFEKLGAYFAFFDYIRYTLTGNGEPQRLRGVGISQDFLDVLGVQPMLGRGFVDEECLWNGPRTSSDWRIKAGARLIGLEEYIRGGFRTAFGILSGAVACVLLIACVNLSNLLLARANARRKEFAIRVALGAGSWRLVRQAMTESLLLAFGGCVLGVPLAMAGTAAVARLQAFNIPLLQTSTFDATA